MAAAAVLFQTTPRLKKAGSLINGLESGKFAKLLARVLQKMHIKGARAFTDEEEEKLQGALNMDAKELELVLESSTFILQQAVYHMSKPSTLKTHLQSIGLDEDKTQVFLQAWTSQGKGLVERMGSSTFYPKQLEDVNWRLNLQMAQSSSSKMKKPNSLFEFVVKEGESKEKIRVEFTHDELYDFYTKLETIQQQLDSLS